MTDLHSPAAPSAHEPTRALPMQDPTPAPAPPRRRPGALSAAVLAGSLVFGGAAGFGGAAAYDYLNPDPAPSPQTGAAANSQTQQTSTAPTGTAEAVAAKVLPSVVQIVVSGQQGTGSGSGVVLSADGMILTNNHVVSGGEELRVSFHDGTSAKATVLGTDPVTDIAVIKAEGVADLTPAAIGKSAELKVGQDVVAVGSPYGLDATVTTGIVSALNRAVSVSGDSGTQGQPSATTYPAIQTDAAINPGNSGGPLVDLAGNVIGINSSIRTDGSSTGQGGSIGLGFAIPIDPVMPIVRQLEAGKTATHARLGVEVGNNQTSELAGTGALVRTVTSGGAADRAGLRAGDVVTKVDQQRIQGADALVANIRGHRPGDKVSLTVLRDGNTEQITATLGSDEGTSTS